MNLVVLKGRLTKDVELKSASNGTSFGKFGLAVKRDFAKDGQTNVDFFNCTAFGKTADVIAQYVHKGDGLCVKGRIQIDKGQDDKYYTSIIVDGFDFAEKASGDTSSTVVPDEDDNPPF